MFKIDHPRYIIIKVRIIKNPIWNLNISLRLLKIYVWIFEFSCTVCATYISIIPNISQYIQYFTFLSHIGAISAWYLPISLNCHYLLLYLYFLHLRLNEVLRVKFHRLSESEHQRDTHTKCFCLRSFEMSHSPECIYSNNLKNVLHCNTRFKIRPMKPRILIARIN